ncbi:multidrug effflux MFS transporter [Francisella philomiragia]|uniref:multidrug effflux MFS transporter n=1 Tax=Francisella philomiragia TaxID=28110 RepID=UPI001907F3C3|nr:multidrug effflux MFS transporter [Francisella philomiragia]MBK2267416.1 multidrug effflux MFS transporter [Francisella philomiragia]MBK2278872.1 multidrug effflux MFS transporter [Francisella philomiragia]MBK2286888.1 multidrug effflux MFS transporter [Francisella philomiragia]MBK2288704.1 multidrug effflux MFS transporter [Francisella philomiragia]MBK2290422.1 multidrug effflux MFS transporter [Francisella philomiragia]
MKNITRDSKLFPIVLALFAALPPLAVNTYAPAIPLIANDFGVSNSTVLTTFATYFIGFSFGMLFWGAISDKYGRKKVIIIGSVIYIISTVLCSYSYNFKMLEIMRLIQGLSDSVGAVIAFSIARDCYKGAKLTNLVASIIIILLIAPIVAPIIGTILTNLTHTWQSTFHFLTIYGVVMLLCAFLIEETLEHKDRKSSLIKLIPSYFQHLSNPRFMLATIASGTIFATLFIFISSSALIYLGDYATGSLWYCIYYGVCCLGSILANVIIKKNSHHVQQLKFLYYSVILIALSCVILILFNALKLDNAFIYTVIMFVLCASVAFSSTLIYSFAIDQIDHSFGTANSIVNFIKNMIAASGSYFISFYHGRDLVVASPIAQFIFALATVILLFGIYKLNKKANRS